MTANSIQRVTNYFIVVMFLASLGSVEVQALTVHQTIDDWRDRYGIVTKFTGYKPVSAGDSAPDPVTVTNWFGKNEKVTSDGAFIGWKFKNQITYLDRSYWWPDTPASRINLKEWVYDSAWAGDGDYWWILDGYENPDDPGALIRPCDRPSDEIPVLRAVYRMSPDSDFWFEQFLHFDIEPQRGTVGTILTSDIPTFTVDFVGYFPMSRPAAMPYSGTLAVWSQTYYDNVEPEKEFYRKIPFSGTLAAKDPDRQQSLCKVSCSLGERLPAGLYRAYMEVRSEQARNEPKWLDVTFKVITPALAVEVEPTAADWQRGSLLLHWRVADSPDITYEASDKVIELSGKHFNVWKATGENYQNFDNAQLVAADVAKAYWTDTQYADSLGVWPAKYWVQVLSGDEQSITAKPSSVPTASCVAGRRFAILCGFNDYLAYNNQAQMTELQTAHSHTMDEVGWIHEALAEKFGNLQKSFDCSNDKGTVENITNSWRTASNETIPGDVLFFYISTHGGAQANRCPYPWLQTWETEYNGDGYTSTIMGKDISRFTAEKGVKVINIIDACFSGAMYYDLQYINSDNIAWICSSTENQLSDCVQSVSEFAQTFMQWGWLDGCADLAKLENVSGYSNQFAGDGVLNLWEIDNYSRALTAGFASQDGGIEEGVNKHFKQTVFMSNEKLLKETIVATGVKTKDSKEVPDRLGFWKRKGIAGFFVNILPADVKSEYWPKARNCAIYINGHLPCLFYDVEYAVDKSSAHSYVRAIKADKTLDNGLLDVRLFEDGANSIIDGSDTWWRCIYGWGKGHNDTEGLGEEYVPLQSGESYKLRVRAVNEYGFGPWSKPVYFETGEKGKIEEPVQVSSSSDASVSGLTVAAVSQEGEDIGVELAVSRTDGTRTVYEGTVSMNAGRTILSGSVSCGEGMLALSITKEGLVSASSDTLTITGQLKMSGAGGSLEFAEPGLTIDEGETAEIRVNGGNEEKASSIKVYLTYNTAVTADVDLSKMKFPLTLTWEAGEVGEKVITIPVKKDTVVEMDEFFTLQLADAQGMELGEDRVCTVTIHDPGYDELEAKIKAGTATKAEQTAWDKLQKAKAPYVCVLADPANAGTVTGSGLYAAGKKVTLKATANKGYVLSGWGSSTGETSVVPANGQDARSPSVSFTMPTEDVTLMAMFATKAEDAESLKIAVEDMTTEADGSIGTLGSDGTWSFDLGACVTSLSLPKLAVSGLPAGLKFDAKTNRITGKATKPGVYMVTVKATNASVAKATDATTATFRLTVPNFECAVLPGLLSATEAYGTVSAGVAFDAGRIDCVPENGWSVKVAGLPAGLKYDARTGKITGIPTAKPGAYTVTFTASKKGEKNQIATITLNIEALPDWAVGTFTGYVKHGDYGLAAMAVAANGKISGKIQHGGTNWTFKADSYTSVECCLSDIDESVVTNYVIQAVATAGKEKRAFELYVADEICALSGMINAKVEGATEDGIQTFSLWRTIWKDKVTVEAAKRILAEWEGTYNVSFEPSENSGYGSGYLSLAVGKDGNVKASGKLADGTSISATSPLMYDAEHGYFMLVYAAPSAYMGGSFALSISFDGPKGVLGNGVEVSKWSSRNPQATGVHGEGFARWVSFWGSYYDKNASLTNFYDRLKFELAELPPLAASCKRTYFNAEDRNVTETQLFEAAPVYLLDEDGLTVSVNAKGIGFDVLKATKPVQDKATKHWKYPGPNDGGLTLTFDQKTGILKGTYTFWYDYLSVNDEIAGKETWTHASQKVSFEGLMVQGENPRGFYLREESSSYEDQKSGQPKAYKYRSSHGIHFKSPDSGWRRLDKEGEWSTIISVNRGESHTFWVDSLSPNTGVAGIDVEGSYAYQREDKEYEEYVGVSEGGEIFDKDGNIAGFFVTLKANNWFVNEYTPKYVRFRVTVDGFYDESIMINNKFKFHHACGRFAIP